MANYIKVANLNIKSIGCYKKKIITNEVILTKERLDWHILMYHKNEYKQLEKYLNKIIEEPDYILEDSTHIDTLIFLKHIEEIEKKARVVVKLATDINEKIYNKNSIITIMRQRNKSWEQTLKNRGKIIYKKMLDISE